MQTHDVLPEPPTVQSKIVSELKHWKTFQNYSGVLQEKDFSSSFWGGYFQKLANFFYNSTFPLICFSHKV